MLAALDAVICGLTVPVRMVGITSGILATYPAGRSRSVLCYNSIKLGKPWELERSIGEMRVLRTFLQCTAFVMLFLFIACSTATTKFSDIWKDETYQGHPKKILVINKFQDPSIRRLFEDEIVKLLKDYEVDAVVKYTVEPPDTVVSDMNAIAAQAKEVGADTVLITRPVGTPRQDLTGALTVHINTRTDVYDMKSNKLILFASADTKKEMGSLDPKDNTDVVPSFVLALVRELSQLGLFGTSLNGGNTHF